MATVAESQPDTETDTDQESDGNQESGLMQHPQHQLLSRAESVGLQLQHVIDTIPESEDDGELNILRQIFSSQSVNDLDSAWRTDGLEKFEGKLIMIESIRRMPSAFPGGLGWYLICDVIDRATGAKTVITTGSVSVVGQLAMAHSLNALPLNVIPRKAERASKNGYFPMHLEIAEVPGA